ncbi:MAG: LptF/LptG family permease [Flavobacteriales bacterium]|nr:LptF/LptG family permease [Flavobacteriales bacterium]MCB9168032.1 LptF/LptG family permease [Flavobacteriales bacterium]
MKRLHLMIIRSYLGPLVITFIIVLFILSMQFLWKYVDDLMGKGLPWYTLTQLMVYATASFVPLALPLAVLLSSIMTLGGLGENSELVPMRSAGLHLFRILRPLMLVSLLLAGFSLFFSNNVLPVANLKFQSLLWDVTRKKPAMNLRPNVFYNGIDGFSIRVKEKDADDGVLKDVLIYDHRAPLAGNRTVVHAATGSMKRSTDGHFLLLTLNDGHFYDERDPTDPDDRGHALVHGTFRTDVIRLDLTGLGLDRTDEELFKSNYKMLTLGQLQHAEDSLHAHYAERVATQEHYLRNALFITRDSVADRPEGPFVDRGSYMRDLGRDERAGLYDLAMNIVRNNINYIDRSLEERRERREQLARFQVEWHRKWMLAFACVIFFFIGAPLGAIIRKGGMGAPTVFAIVFFLVFHILSFSTEKLVVSDKFPAWPGMWISTMVLLPVGLFLTWKAATDSPLLDRDAYYRGWDRLVSRSRKPRHADPPVVQ